MSLFYLTRVAPKKFYRTAIKSLEVESSLEEKVDKLLSESDDKSEDLIDLLEKKLEALKKMAKK